MNRQTLRQNILNQRQQLTLFEQQTVANKITQRLQQSSIFQNNEHIALYIANKGEVDTSAILQFAWQQNKKCYLPVLHEQSLQFVRYKKNDVLKPNRFNILEPEVATDKIITPEDLDLILTPLVAFDLHGNRLGMGRGYYDRAFEFLQSTQRPAKPLLLGIAYELQKVNEIAAEKWDVKLDAVLTEKHFFKFSSV